MQAAAWEYGTGISLPLASVLDEKTDRGVSLILSPEDTLLDVRLATTAEGRYISAAEPSPGARADDPFCHGHCRPRGRLARRLAVDDQAYAPFFDSPTRRRRRWRAAGHIARWTEQDRRATAAADVFSLYWDASFQWPVSRDVPAAGRHVAKSRPGRRGTPQRSRSMKMSYALMNQRGRQLRAAGFVPLSYFHSATSAAGIFGKQPAPNNLPANEQWKDATWLFAEELRRQRLFATRRGRSGLTGAAIT